MHLATMLSTELPIQRSATLAVVAVLSFVVVRIVYSLIRTLGSPLRTLPGPKSTSFFWGHLREIFKSGPSEIHLKWTYEHGHTFVYKGFFGTTRLVTLDPKALSYILNHSYDYLKPEEFRRNLAELMGEGLLIAEGDVHKRQRRAMNPSFARPYIRELTDIFHGKSLELRNILTTQLTSSGGEITTNICSWLSKTTLDIIGLAGFDYDFEALNPTGSDNELYAAYSKVMKEGVNSGVFGILRNIIPILRKIPTQGTRDLAKSKEVMTRVGFGIVRSKKQAIIDEKGGHSSKVGRNDISGRDILSRLIAANMATDLPENHRLSDNDVVSQISTFFVAGHETTAMAATWALFALSQSPAVQDKLRKELLSVSTDTPSMDELNALPYLESVVRETMRLHAPVSSTFRVSAKDDVIPLDTPYEDKTGILRHQIPISKGDMIFIPILILNVHKDIWGDDALEFRPERWADHPENNRDLPSVYANMLTFLAGTRACIGYRFALVELKCILFALLRSFQFELGVPPEDIEKKTNLVTRPFLKGAPKGGAQLPMKVTLWKAS